MNQSFPQGPFPPPQGDRAGESADVEGERACSETGGSRAPHPKVLVANRGEIAVRILRALRQAGHPTVAIHSDADAGAPHVRIADEAVALGGSTPRESYLDIEKVVEAARRTGAAAVHPGYGFLSENAEFRAACDRAGLVFIGPPAGAIRAMGNKLLARRTMADAGVPVVPGSLAPARDAAAARRDAAEAGYPVMLKAAAGGGGKGMRLVERDGDLPAAFEAASREAVAAFGDGSLYVEKFLEGPRHVEVQVLADRHGRVVHLFERECSVQRRHQKVVEETPACDLPRDVRDEMCAVAVRAAQAIGYECAGTVEFLVDCHKRFYFLEMNTRLQVEHPITEVVVGVDLVRAMTAVAFGAPLPWSQEDLGQRGHAIECRVYAEDPFNGFLPSPGRLVRYRRPGGPFVRVDDGVEEGDEVTAFYDPMVAKVVAWGEDRGQAVARMAQALREYEIAGVRHNVPFLLHVLASDEFLRGRYDTGILGRIGLPGDPGPGVEEAAAAVAALVLAEARAPASPGGRGRVSAWRAAVLPGVGRRGAWR